MNYLIVLLLYSNLSGIFGKSKSERLLLNDPSVLADRLGRLENSVTILKQTVATQNAELQIQKTTIQALEQENTKLSMQNQHHTSDI
jgi:cell division protein FtsB